MNATAERTFGNIRVNVTLRRPDDIDATNAIDAIVVEFVHDNGHVVQLNAAGADAESLIDAIDWVNGAIHDLDERVLGERYE